MINLTVIKNQITELGLLSKTTFCTNGKEVIDRVTELFTKPLLNDRPISIILTDFQMPKKNGIQVLEEVRALYRRKSEDLGRELKTPEVVFLTAYVSQHFTKHLQEIGLDQIYEKPLHDSQIYQILSNANAKISGKTQITHEEESKEA